MSTLRTWLRYLPNCLVQNEPPVPETILGHGLSHLQTLPNHATVCIKVSAANDLPYPFAVSGAFVGRVVEEIHSANASLRIILTEGGVGRQPVRESAARHGLLDLPGAEFVDAESVESKFVENPLAPCHGTDGFWLPAHWLDADARILLTTCKLRSHHFQRWYSGGVRNLIGLLPRSRYKLSTSKREMRSMVHQRGMDAMAADLYATAGRGLLTILDGRLLARQDEHLPLRFTRKVGRIIVSDDAYMADEEMIRLLHLPFRPPYLDLIRDSCKMNES